MTFQGKEILVTLNKNFHKIGQTRLTYLWGTSQKLTRYCHLVLRLAQLLSLFSNVIWVRNCVIIKIIILHSFAQCWIESDLETAMQSLKHINTLIFKQTSWLQLYTGAEVLIQKFTVDAHTTLFNFRETDWNWNTTNWRDLYNANAAPYKKFTRRDKLF